MESFQIAIRIAGQKRLHLGTATGDANAFSSGYRLRGGASVALLEIVAAEGKNKIGVGNASPLPGRGLTKPLKLSDNNIAVPAPKTGSALQSIPTVANK